MPMPCTTCHFLNEEAAKFCNQCGTRLVAQPAQATPAPAVSHALKASVLRPETLPEGAPSLPGRTGSPVGLGWDAPLNRDAAQLSAPAPPTGAAVRAPFAETPSGKKKGRRKAERMVVGIVRGRQDRSYPSGGTVWDFRVERVDEAGSPLPPVPVEMIGHRFSSTIDEGDRIEIDKRWKPGELLRVKKVKNLTTGIVVKARGAGLKPWIPLLIFLSFVLFILMLFVVGNR